MNKNRLITVLTPFYNSEKFIKNPINSVLNQTYQNWELICIDDCSTDGTYKILQEYAQKDSRIKVYKTPKNLGKPSKTTNFGMQYCNGSHIQLLGHDDELTADTLEEIAKRIDETNADIIIPDAEFVNDLCDPNMKNFKMIGVMSPDGWEKTPINRDIILTGREACAYSIGWRIHAWAAYSNKLLVDCGGWTEEGMNGDEFTARKLFLNANKVTFSKGTYRYLRRPDSISMKLNAKSFDIFTTEEKLIKLLIDNKFEKDLIEKSKNELYSRYFYSLKRFETNRNKLTKSERKDIKKYLKQGFKLTFKNANKNKFVKDYIKHIKCSLFLKIYNHVAKRLKKEGYISD